MTSKKSKNSEKYFTWLSVLNTTEERSQQNSLSHDLPPGNTIRESTKKVNKYLKTSRPKLYSKFVECKQNILSKIRTNSDVFNESDFSDSELRTFYDSFNVTSAGNSEVVYDQKFVWSYIVKKGMKEESADVPKDSMWEPRIDINTDNHHRQHDSENQFNGSLKAAGALLINKQQKKYIKQTHYNTRSTLKRSINENTSFVNVLTETPANGVEKINDSDSEVLRNKNLKNAKRNLKSEIENVSSQVSETSEANLSCDFIPEDFQAQSTQIFSDTFANSVPRSSRTKKASKFLSNDAINQPRDSGIEEDSRDENGVHQNIENEKENCLLKSGKETSRNRKVLGESKSKEQDSLSSENTESLTTPRKCLKIIGDQTLKKKYKIIGKNNSPPQLLKPIVEEKPVSVSKSNDRGHDRSKHEPDNNSESDFKSIKSDDEKSSSDKKAKESSDEYFDVHDDNDASSSEEEKVSSPESMAKNGSVKTDVDSDSEDSRQHRQRVKNKLKKSTSPWVTKQYRDLKRLRLLDDSPDDSVIESSHENESVTIAKQNVSAKNKKTLKKATQEIEKLNKKSNLKSNKKKSFLNGKLLNSDSEIDNPQITNEDFDESTVIDSKLNDNNREYSESDSAGSHRSLQRNKKLKHRKKRRKVSRTDSLSSREQSYDRQTQHHSKDAKSYEDSSQSHRDQSSKQNIHHSHQDDDAVSDVDSGKSTKQKTKSDYSDDSKEDVDALCSKNSSTNRDSSALSINDIVKSKQGRENSVKNEIFTTSDDEKDSEDEKAMSENQKKQLQNVKKMDLMASGESSDSETERENFELQNKNESSCQKNERTCEKIKGESYESDADVFDGRETAETILPHQENQNNEVEEEDEGLPTLQAQEKLQQKKRLTFDDSSESEDSEAETVSMNKHKSQLIESELAKEPNVDEKSERADRASSDEGSDEEGIMSESQKKKLQNFKKMDLMASDESSESETEHENVDSQNIKKSPFRKNERTCEKNTEKSNESDDDSINGRKSEVIIAPHKESQNDESDIEDEVLPTPHAQEKLQNMKRLNFDDSSESEDSETESVIIPKTQVIKSEIAQKPNVSKESERVNKASSDRESDEEDTMSENQKNHLQQIKKMDLVASDESEDSEEENQISKSRSRKLSDEKIKREDSEDDDKTSDAALQEKINEKSRRAGSSKDSDGESVHYDSDNIDVKEHKVIIPEDLKNSNLLEQFGESNFGSSNSSKNGGKSEVVLDKKDENELENDDDEEIDNIVPVEVSKRMQQLKRLNLYENDDSSDSDGSLKNNRNISQRSSNVPRKERDDSSSDEKESITEEPTASTSKVKESEVNDTKEEIEDNVADEKELKKAVEENQKNVIIPETQESVDFASDNNQSQEMFSSLEDLTEIPPQIPPTPQSVSKKTTPTKPDREKITEISQLVEQEELMKSSLEPTMTLDDIDSDDDEIFVIEVPKNIFDKDVVGKKLVVTKNTLSIGDAHYEAVRKDASPIMSCVLNSKRKKFKTVNIRPLRSVVARRRKDADDYIENAEIENLHKSVKSQRFTRESDQESVSEARDIEQASTKKSKSKKRKLSHTDEVPSASSATLEQSKTSKKKSAKSKKIDSHDLIDDREISEEKTEQDEAKKTKALKRKLYASDHEIKDVDSNVTDDSFVNNSKKATDTANTSAKLVKRIIRKELTLKKLNVENEVVSISKNENNNDVEVPEQSKSKTKAKKKSNKQNHQQTDEESQLDKFKNTLEDDKKMFENMFRESFLLNISTVEEEIPVKKKAKKRKNTNVDVNSEPKEKTKKKSKAEEVEDDPVATAKPKRSRKKVEKPKEEPASVQIMKFINDAFKCNSEKLNVSTSSNDSRYGALDIERVTTKKNYSSSSSSDESEEKYAKPRFQIRDKSKEKELTTTSATLFKEEVKDEKKKIKKIHFDE